MIYWLTSGNSPSYHSSLFFLSFLPKNRTSTLQVLSKTLPFTNKRQSKQSILKKKLISTGVSLSNCSPSKNNTPLFLFPTLLSPLYHLRSTNTPPPQLNTKKIPHPWYHVVLCGPLGLNTKGSYCYTNVTY